MTTLLDTLRKAAVTAVSADNPMSLLLGTVTRASPLEVNVDQRFTLSAAFLIVPESVSPLELNPREVLGAYIGDGALPTEPVVLRRGLEAGDRVLLLRVQGGQKYVVLDRVVGA